jgi:hypothetical protein
MTTTVNGDTGVSAVQDGSIVAADFAASLFAASLASSGYQKLPSGLIIQWGNADFTTAGVQVTYPIPFPNSFLQTIVGGVQGATSNGVISSVLYGSQSNSGFKGVVNVGVNSTSWIAVGY